MREFGLPVGETLLVLNQNGFGNFFGEIRVRQLLLHFHDFRLDFLNLLRKPGLFGGGINVAFRTSVPPAELPSFWKILAYRPSGRAG